VALGLGAWSVVHADDTKIVSQETVRTTGADGVVTEKHIVKKIRARTVVDFEEASIEGKVKKPNAAYLLHGADLDFKHLYRIKHNQRSRIMSSYEYLR
jgi:hypothetical protein